MQLFFIVILHPLPCHALDRSSNEALPCRLHLHDINRHLIKVQDSDEDLVQFIPETHTETVPCRTTVRPKLPLLFHYSPRAMIGSLPHTGWSLTRAEVLDWFEREAKPEAEPAPEEALSQ